RRPANLGSRSCRVKAQDRAADLGRSSAGSRDSARAKIMINFLGWLAYSRTPVVGLGGTTIMAFEGTARSSNLRPVTKIIASYVGNHVLAPDQLSALITAVDQAVRQLGAPVQAEPARQPAVPVKRSVQRDHVVCLECGFRGQTLRRHLGSRHGLQI